MKSSQPPPAKRTITVQRGNGNQSPQSPRRPAKGPQPQQQKGDAKIEGKTDNNTNESKAGKTVTSEPICDICAQNVPGPEREKIFAFGKCDHHVCYVCSARLRAICDQLECPICRDKLECVIFSATKDKPYDKHDLTSYIYDEKYRIYFENAAIEDAFGKLLKFECLKCLKEDQTASDSRKVNESDATRIEFPDVTKLRNHLNFKHKLVLCDLCLQHNKLFPFEYSYYDHASLRKHQKEGERNTSHKGHPDCELCGNSFFNQDDLLQHMSREHYHCHLCGRHNTTMHIYFSDYPSLRVHFKAEHYLCERGNCRHEQFTSAFDNKIDYQLHIAEVHGGSANASRGEARQRRTITLDSAPHRQLTNRHQPSVPENAAVVTTGTMATANASDPRRQIPESLQMQVRQQRLPTRSDFPTLGNADSSYYGFPTSQSVTVASSSGASQFPSLTQVTPTPTSTSVSTSYRITAGPSSSRPAFNRTAGGGTGRPDQLNQMDFPPLPEQPRPKGNKSKSKQQKATVGNEALTLDQLINNSLVLSSRNNIGNKNKSNKANKRPLKFQL